VPADVQVGTDSPMTEADMPEIKQDTQLMLELYIHVTVHRNRFLFK
jgi:hypothetical protein